MPPRPRRGRPVARIRPARPACAAGRPACAARTGRAPSPSRRQAARRARRPAPAACPAAPAGGAGRTAPGDAPPHAPAPGGWGSNAGRRGQPPLHGRLNALRLAHRLPRDLQQPRVQPSLRCGGVSPERPWLPWRTWWSRWSTRRAERTRRRKASRTPARGASTSNGLARRISRERSVAYDGFVQVRGDEPGFGEVRPGQIRPAETRLHGIRQM